MKNVVSQEPDVTQTSSRRSSAGQADVGFVYITDAKAAAGKVKAIKLPAKAKPGTEDVIAVVKSTTNTAAAQAFVKGSSRRRSRRCSRPPGFGKP